MRLTQTSNGEVWMKGAVIFFKAFLHRFVFETLLQFAELSLEIVDPNPQDTR